MVDAVHSSVSSTTDSTSRAVRQLILPMVWLTLAVLGWLFFMSWQLWLERDQLIHVHQAQETEVAAAGKLRASLDALATSTARLAEGGNAGARVVVEQLRRQGITINSAAIAVGK